jgi:hypothetical protein
VNEPPIPPRPGAEGPQACNGLANGPGADSGVSLAGGTNAGHATRMPTAYERSQIDAIARWKSTGPSRLAEAVDRLTAPLTWVVGHFVPRSVVTRLVSTMEEVAARSDSAREVARSAGVADVRELAGASLETCDRLAERFSAWAERFALVESTATAFGGPLFHVPAQLIAALRSVSRIGHCYGYPLDQPVDRATVIDIMEISMLQSVGDRRRTVAALHAAFQRHSDALEGAGDVLARTSRNMIAEEALDLVPVVGTAVSFLFDSQFMHAVDETARRIYQERWLRDRGVVAAIDPAVSVARRSSLAEMGLALGQGLYCAGALVGFAASAPARLVQHAVGCRGPIGRGARHGSDRAVRDAREFLDGLKTSYEAEAAIDAGTAPV